MSIRTKLNSLFLVIILLLTMFVGYKVFEDPQRLYRLKTKMGLYDSMHSIQYQSLITMYQRVDKNISPTSVVFIGDSLVQGLAVSEICPNAVNFGIGHDTTEGVLQRLPHYQSIQKAEALVIAVGFNDLNKIDNLTLLANFDAILETIDDRVAIFISAIHPVDEQLVNHSQISNQRIQAINLQLAKKASGKNSINFSSVYAKLSKNGKLDSRYHVGDGIHLNKEGNALWITQLREDLMAASGGKSCFRNKAD
ncbi:MAG: lysophospholipase L1-like esterase [Paraglaciecola sp.]